MSGKQIRIYNLARDVPDQRDYTTYFKISKHIEESTSSKICSNSQKIKRTKNISKICCENKRNPQQVAIKV